MEGEMRTGFGTPDDVTAHHLACKWPRCGPSQRSELYLPGSDIVRIAFALREASWLPTQMTYPPELGVVN